MKGARGVAVGVGLTAFILSLVLLWENPSERQPGILAVPGGGPADRFDWVPDAKQSYRLEIDSDVRLTLMGPKAPQRLAQRIEGTLHLRVLEVTADLVSIGFQIEPLRYSLNGQRDAGLEAGLSLPFVADFEKNGRPGAFRFADGLERTERKILEEAILTFQTVLPPNERGSWTVTEQNATGRYLARYENRTPGTLLKRKTLYTEVDPQVAAPGAREPAEVQLRNSVATLRLRSEVAWLESAKIQEELVIDSDGRRIANVVMRADLELEAIDSAADVALFRGAADPLVEANTILAGVSPADPAKAAATTNARFAELLEQMEREEDQGIRWTKRLADVLLADPTIALRLRDLLEQRETRPGSRARIIHALELAGHGEAQAVLISVAEGRSTLAIDHLRAVVALGGLANPDEGTVRFLLDVAADRGDPRRQTVANAAALAVGSLGHALSEANPDRASAVGRALAHRLEGSADPLESEVLLKALGNARNAETTPAVFSRLDDESPFVRAAAARTAARLGADDALGVLTERVRNEPDTDVRSSLVAALDDLDEASGESLQVVNSLVLAEKDAAARHRMVRYIAKNRNLYAGTDSTLRRLSLTDPSPRVRQRAMAALLRPTESAPEAAK